MYIKKYFLGIIIINIIKIFLKLIKIFLNVSKLESHDLTGGVYKEY